MDRTKFHVVGRSAIFALALLISGLQAYQVYVQVYQSGAEVRYLYTWDMLPYLGSAIAMDGLSRQETHRITYDYLKSSVPPKHFTEMVGDFYRRPIYEDPDSFFAMLPFFSIKRLYPATMWVQWKLGVNPVSAGGYTSAAAYIGVAAIVFLWLRTVMNVLLASAVTAAIVTLPMISPIAIYRTPDALSAALLLAAFYATALGRTRLAICISAIAILARPDAIIALAGLCALAIWRRDWAGCLLGTILGGGIFIAATQGGYSWATLMHHTFVAPLLAPHQFEPVLSIAEYFDIYLRQLRLMPTQNPFMIVMGFVALCAVLVRTRRFGLRDTQVFLLLICIAGVAGHWAIFPVAAPRYVAPYYLAIIVILLVSLTAAFNDAARSRRRGIR